MEELVGHWWHRAVMRLAQNQHSHAAVHLKDMEKSIRVMFRGGGGSPTLRLAPSSAQRHGGPRGMIQKLAGTNQRAHTATLEPEVLALPATLAIFEDSTLNRDLYLWLAIQSAHYSHTGNWVSDNVSATRLGLQFFAGFAPRFDRLLQAHLAQRPLVNRMRGTHADAENSIRTALNGSPSERCMSVAPVDVFPVWIWVGTSGNLTLSALSHGNPSETTEYTKSKLAQDKQRRPTQRAPENEGRAALVLPFRGEALMSWSEMVQVNRSTDDEEDGNAVAAANDMDKLSVSPDGQTLAARVKFDLDLPSSSEDDAPLGPGQRFPEWDYRLGVLIPNHCVVQTLQARHAPAYVPPAALRLTAKYLRRRMEKLRDAPRPQYGQESGDDIDLDAWVRFRADQLQSCMHSDAPPIYTRHAKQDRSLATLLLADLSLSTDAYATPKAKVIDVIRDALFVFGEALNAVGDPFAMWGFSSVRRSHIRMQHLKRFEDTWCGATQARVGAIKPGYYTRMGAAIRHATDQLKTRPERKRLLMILTDGKPNDLDIYEGRYGLEDTRHAIHEAQAAGLFPFCVTVDESGHDYLPMLFGASGYALVKRPEDLVKRLTHAWVALAR